MNHGTVPDSVFVSPLPLQVVIPAFYACSVLCFMQGLCGGEESYLVCAGDKAAANWMTHTVSAFSHSSPELASLGGPLVEESESLATYSNAGNLSTAAHGGLMRHKKAWWYTWRPDDSNGGLMRHKEAWWYTWKPDQAHGGLVRHMEAWWGTWRPVDAHGSLMRHREAWWYTWRPDETQRGLMIHIEAWWGTQRPFNQIHFKMSPVKWQPFVQVSTCLKSW